MTNERIFERLKEYGVDTECGHISELDGRIVIQVVPSVMINCPDDIKEWQAEAVALLEAIADDATGGSAISLPEKVAIALKAILDQRAQNWLVRYLTA